MTKKPLSSYTTYGEPIARLLAEELEIDGKIVQLYWEGSTVSCAVKVKGAEFHDFLCYVGMMPNGHHEAAVKKLLHYKAFADKVNSASTNGPAIDDLRMRPVMRDLLIASGRAEEIVSCLWPLFGETNLSPKGHVWKTKRAAPDPISGKNCKEHGADIKVHFADAIPWTYGTAQMDELDILTFELSPFVVLRINHSVYEIRMTGHLPLAIRAAALTRPLRETLSHPVLDQHDISVRYIKEHAKGTSIVLKGPCFEKEEISLSAVDPKTVAPLTYAAMAEAEAIETAKY